MGFEMQTGKPPGRKERQEKPEDSHYGILYFFFSLGVLRVLAVELLRG
jgi:hypothetical protein